MKKRLKTKELVELARPKRRELFGPRTDCGKFKVPPDILHDQLGEQESPLWFVLTFHGIGSLTIHSTGDSARAALNGAGLSGWIEDQERKASL
jgi:hypothetical protein